MRDEHSTSAEKRRRPVASKAPYSVELVSMSWGRASASDYGDVISVAPRLSPILYSSGPPAFGGRSAPSPVQPMASTELRSSSPPRDRKTVRADSMKKIKPSPPYERRAGASASPEIPSSGLGSILAASKTGRFMKRPASVSKPSNYDDMRDSELAFAHKYSPPDAVPAPAAQIASPDDSLRLSIEEMRKDPYKCAKSPPRCEPHFRRTLNFEKGQVEPGEPTAMAELLAERYYLPRRDIALPYCCSQCEQRSGGLLS